MANPWAGEVAITLDGQRHVAKLTLGALAELEAALEAGSLLELVERFEAGRFSTRDVLALIVAGLRGGGWQGTAGDLLKVEIGGGPVEAARAAAELLARAQSCPDKVVGPYLVDAAIDAQGRAAPAHFREVFRTRGPSNYPEHGRQAER